MTTAIVNWQEKLAAMSGEAAAAEVMTGKFASTRAGVLKINDQAMPNNELPCVIVDSIYENHYYAESFNANNITSPVCFAFGRNKDGMAPHADCLTPQNDSCDGCPLSAWGTAPNGGRGKACKEIRRLALIPADALKDPSKIGAAQIVYLRVPVLSVKNWSGYVNTLAATLKVPPFAVMTRVYFTPDAKSQFAINFDLVGRITDDEVLAALYEKREQVQKQIAFPYERPNPEDAEEPKSTAAKAAGKKAKM